MGNENVETALDRWRPLSWSSIIFGALVALAVSTMLHILGVGISASVVDANSRTMENLQALGGVSGIWFLISTSAGLFVGGFVAATLSRTFTSERAVLYGIGVWALYSLVTVSVAIPAVIKGAGNAIEAAGTVVDRAANAIGGVGSTAAQTANQTAQQNPGLAERVQRTLLGSTGGQADQATVQEITNLVGQRLLNGQFTGDQKERLNAAVARAANIPLEDARRRVDEAQTTINTTMQQAQESLRRAADTARIAVAAAAYWAFGALLIGAIAALVGARYGELDEEDLPTFARMRYVKTR